MWKDLPFGQLIPFQSNVLLFVEDPVSFVKPSNRKKFSLLAFWLSFCYLVKPWLCSHTVSLQFFLVCKHIDTQPAGCSMSVNKKVRDSQRMKAKHFYLMACCFVSFPEMSHVDVDIFQSFLFSSIIQKVWQLFDENHWWPSKPLSDIVE